MDRRAFLEGIAANALGAPLLSAVHAPARASATRGARSLADLPVNAARDLGPYANPAVQRGATSITDYSGIAYDPVARRMCLFGGGHGPSQETDIRVLDLATLTWSSLYETTPPEAMTQANGDRDRGRWISTNQPYARHTYNMTLVWKRRFYLLTPWGMPDGPEGKPPPRGGRIAWYDFDAKAWSYSRHGADTAPVVPWYFAAAAAVDPVSNRIVVAGPNNQAGMGSVWLYDPERDEITTSPLAVDFGGEPDLVHCPANDRFYVLQGDGRVWEIALDRETFANTRVEALKVQGTPPAAARGTVCGYAWDPANRIIGGNVMRGVFHAFDPQEKRWTARRIEVEQGSRGTPNQAFHCLEFDPTSGCFIFLQTDPDETGVNVACTTWAYRYGTRSSPRAAGVGDLAVTLDFGNGRVARFDGREAIDQGDYVGEHVRQKSYLARDARFPDWRVYLRVDADATGRRLTGERARDEIVVEYGRATGARPAHHLQPYTASIEKDGSVIARYTVPRHWWYARWRHESAPRPVVRTPHELIVRGWIPHLGPGGTFGRAANAVAVAWPGPLRTPQRPGPDYPFNMAMASGGDNAQIGYLTEYAADYVLHGSAASLASVRTEGEWCGNWPMHVRDETGAVLDVRNARLDWQSNGGAVADAPQVNFRAEPDFVALDVAHWYPCANLPWLLTDDPYYLEALQFGANWQLLYNAQPRAKTGLHGLVDPYQTRAYAWGLRDLFLLAATCPAETPQWLRPRAYWQQCVDDNRRFAMQFATSPARVHALFRTWTRSDADPAWQSAWLSAVVGIAVGQGFEDWEPVFRWSIGKQIQQTNGTSGWPREWPVPYYSMPLRSRETLVAFPYRDTAADATTCRDWADYWKYYASGSDGRSDATGRTVDTSGWDGRTLQQQRHEVGPSYFLHLRSALAIAVSRGVPGARGCYDYLHGELQRFVMARYGVPGQARFSIDPVDD